MTEAQRQIIQRLDQILAAAGGGGGGGVWGAITGTLGDQTDLATALGLKGPPPSDAAYDEATWNGVTTIAPSKNAVRDKIEAVVASIPAAPAILSTTLVDLNANTDPQVLYTVPVNKKLVLTDFVFRDASEAITFAQIELLGESGEVLLGNPGNFTLDSFQVNQSTVMSRRESQRLKDPLIMVSAGLTVTLVILTPHGSAATCKAHVIGYLVE